MDLLNTQTRMNGGNYTRANSEDLLIAVRGAGGKELAQELEARGYAEYVEAAE